MELKKLFRRGGPKQPKGLNLEAPNVTMQSESFRFYLRLAKSLDESNGSPLQLPLDETSVSHTPL